MVGGLAGDQPLDRAGLQVGGDAGGSIQDGGGQLLALGGGQRGHTQSDAASPGGIEGP